MGLIPSARGINDLSELYNVTAELRSYLLLIDKYSPSENLTKMIEWRSDILDRCVADLHSFGVLESEIIRGYPEYDRFGNTSKLEMGLRAYHSECLYYCEKFNAPSELIEVHRNRISQLNEIIDNNIILESIAEGKSEEEARSELRILHLYLDKIKGVKA